MVKKCVYLYVFGHSGKLSIQKFFDKSTPSIRKVEDGGEKPEKNDYGYSDHELRCQFTTKTPTARPPPKVKYAECLHVVVAKYFHIIYFKVPTLCQNISAYE